jgi:predicted transcriptional regulator
LRAQILRKLGRQQEAEELERPGGATLKELRKATSWQPHSIRGFLSVLGKNKGVAVESTKSPDGERTYSLKA